MRLNFKRTFPFDRERPTNFREKIMTGQKKHTLREDPKERWRIGMRIDFTEGSRFKPDIFCNDFLHGKQRITMRYNAETDMLFIRVGSFALDSETMEKFIKNDGFDDVRDFIRWFFTGDCFELDGYKHWDGFCLHFTKHLFY